ncbi:hypothetical protein DFH06DRAFT_700073 [Mycena polygramma]|nr:hypothetical protein DFH06DRAFT_700073 [Mycena polygramma]
MHWPWTNPYKPDPSDLPQTFYSSQLLCARRGTAIYHSEPLATRLGLEHAICLGIGDVGFISRNQFRPMFRATEPMDEANLPHDLRLTGFVPLDPCPVASGRYPAGIQCVRNVDTDLVHDGGNSSSLIKEGTVIRFTPTAERGAALLTKYPVWHTDAVDEKPFVDYMLKNYKSWMQLGSRAFGRPIDMMFVTGVDVSTYYTTVCYSSAHGPAPSADLIIPNTATKAQIAAQAQMRIEDCCEWACFQPRIPHAVGPDLPLKADAETDEYLQQLEEHHEALATNSVFIRALRFRHRKVIFTDTVRTAKLWLDGVLWPTAATADPLQPLADYIFSHSIACPTRICVDCWNGFDRECGSIRT